MDLIKYQIEIEVVSKPKAEYTTDEYFELDLPVAPAVMVENEILVEGSDISQEELESAICRRLGITKPEETKKGIFKRRSFFFMGDFSIP